ncbi:hypothetical protein AGOR_G00143130 [Albula goreensis]|uniref:Phosphatidylinositol-glycan biosynthesis class X protein n=1 Tax=Albula goreensis TaxID=1534307 RepID=A0A8T3D451_9TELE|nr:hypothetical protein AGOR_G00143130 [Albula goreensis]
MVILGHFCILIVSLGIFGAIKADDGYCGLSGKWMESLTLSRDILKSGFHRELVTLVECDPSWPEELQVLLVQKLPRGAYGDPYQLASLRQDTGLQVLLDTEVDLEAPAYESSGFSMFVYPTRDAQNPKILQTVVPIHGRYHRPSDSGQGWERIEIEPPRLLLRADGCEQLLPSGPHVLVDAPCSVHNLSLCKWLEIHLPQDQRHVSLEVPSG